MAITGLRLGISVKQNWLQSALFKYLGDKGMDEGDKSMSLDKHCADGSSGKENQLVLWCSETGSPKIRGKF